MKTPYGHNYSCRNSGRGFVPALPFVIEGPSMEKSPVGCGVTAEGETMPVMATAELPGECSVSLSGLCPVVHG